MLTFARACTTVAVGSYVQTWYPTFGVKLRSQSQYATCYCYSMSNPVPPSIEHERKVQGFFARGGEAETFFGPFFSTLVSVDAVRLERLETGKYLRRHVHEFVQEWGLTEAAKDLSEPSDYVSRSESLAAVASNHPDNLSAHTSKSHVGWGRNIR